MSNLKDLKIRIKSVKSTQKITEAMKLVAASRLKKARDKAEAAHPYASRMERMLIALSASINREMAPKIMAGTGKEDIHLFVVVTSDRGLCGSLNSSLVKEVKIRLNSLVEAGKQVKLICIGKKGHEQLEKDYKDYIIYYKKDLSKKKNLSFSDAESIAHKLVDMFGKEEFDICTIFYNQFKTALVQKVTAQQLIPLNIKTDAELVAPGKDEIKQTTNEQSLSIYEFEPSERYILEDLLPRNIAVQIFHALLENIASEQGARMTAMDSATRNAGDMIKRLTLVYNRTRQAVITKELIEIISGAEAL